MIVKHFYIEKIAHSSYLLAADSTCAIIDPARDVDRYIETAHEMDLTITHILQTHLHADFISGHIELAKKTGAVIVVPASGNVSFESKAVKEDDILDIEELRIHVVETPGHTPEHVSYVVVDTQRADDPIGVFTGDTLFTGDVGRPDLFPNMADALARKLYHSLFEKLLTLPDYCEVYPAHGAGSLCGKSMGAKYTSTIGYERKFNPTLQIKDVESFVKALTQDMPAAPDHFSRSSAENAKGPTPIDELSKPVPMTPDAFYEASRKEDHIILDVRSYPSFGGLHIPGSINMDVEGNLPTFAGWILPYDKKILLVAESEQDVDRAVLWLQRVGLDHTVGYLKDEMYEWPTYAYPMDHIPQITPKELCERLKKEDLILLDSRDKAGHDRGHIENSVHIATPDLRTRWTELDKNDTIVIYCASGVRSSIGASILKQKGFHNILNLAGGYLGYLAYKEQTS